MQPYQKCPYAYGKDDDVPIEPHVDLYLLVDTDGSPSDMTHISYMISALLLDLPVDPYGTSRVALNMTQQGSWVQVLEIGEESNKMNIAHRMMREDGFWAYSNGLDMLETMTQLRRHFEQEADEERRENTGGTNSKIVLFVIPKERPDEDEDDLEDMFKDFKRDFPDIKLLFFANSQDWKEYASDKDEDFFRTSTSLIEFKRKMTERMEKIPDRLVFQRCKQSKDYEGGNQYEAYLTPGLRRRMGYDDHWFFDSDRLEVKMRLRESGSYGLRVCEFRDIDEEEPDNCKETGSGNNEIEFKFKECEKCKPIYFNVDVLGEPTGSPTCSDRRECRFPENVKVEVTHKNMRCNSATSILLSPILLLVLQVARRILS